MTSGIVNAVIVGITIIVVAVPEGLPLAVTISLAYSVNQMRKENNLVRRLEAAETMGGANEILTDKTGTLTTNRMTVIQYFAQLEIHKSLREVSLTTQDLILTGCSVNSNSYILREGEEEKRIGNQTECALLAFVERELRDLARAEKSYDDIKRNYEVLKMIPFNSETKKMTVVVKHDKGVRVFTKGASECIIDDCAFLLDPNVKTQLTNTGAGSPRAAPVINLDLNLREKLKKALIDMAEKSLRTIALGYKDISLEEYNFAMGELEKADSRKTSPAAAREPDSPSKDMVL